MRDNPFATGTGDEPFDKDVEAPPGASGEEGWAAPAH